MRVPQKSWPTSSGLMLVFTLPFRWFYIIGSIRDGLYHRTISWIRPPQRWTQISWIAISCNRKLPTQAQARVFWDLLCTNGQPLNLVPYTVLPLVTHITSVLVLIMVMRCKAHQFTVWVDICRVLVAGHETNCAFSRCASSTQPVGAVSTNAIAWVWCNATGAYRHNCVYTVNGIT